MKKQINLLASKRLLENQVVRSPNVIISTSRKRFADGAIANRGDSGLVKTGLIIPWPAPNFMKNVENKNMYTPSPETSLHLLAHAPMGIVITDDTGLVLWCNDTLVEWAGKKTGECVGRTEAGILSLDDSSTSISNGPHKFTSATQGKDRWIMRCPVSINNDQRVVYYFDVTEEENLRKERTQLARQLEQHNTVEPISGLLNEQGIKMGLEPLISRSRRYDNPLSVVIMPVTNLDSIQKTTGQVGADKMVLAISRLLRDQLRWADLVGRIDSGDFIFVLPETDQSAAIALANKIASKLADLNIPLDAQANHKPVACFGIASWTKGDDSAQLLARTTTAATIASKNGTFSVETA